MLVQAGLCRTCPETTLLVFPRDGSFVMAKLWLDINHISNNLFIFPTTGEPQRNPGAGVSDDTLTVEALSAENTIQDSVLDLEALGISNIDKTLKHDTSKSKHFNCLSSITRKPDFCLCEDKGADQLCSNCSADQPL